MFMIHTIFAFAVWKGLTNSCMAFIIPKLKICMPVVFDIFDTVVPPTLRASPQGAQYGLILQIHVLRYLSITKGTTKNLFISMIFNTIISM